MPSISSRVWTTASTLAFIALSSLTAHADQYTAQTDINAVTVYPDSARIERVAQLTVSAGRHTLKIHDLPIGLIEQSLRISASDGEALHLGQIDLREQLQSSRALAAAEKLEAELKRIEQAKIIVIDEIDRVNGQIDLVYEMGYSNDGASQYHQLPMEKWTEAWALIETQIATYQNRRLELEQKRSELDEELELISRKLSEIGEDRRSTYEAEIEIYSTAASTQTISVTYQIDNAYWAPVYDADLDTKTEKLSLSTLATVQQKTGEDWTDVKLSLSTRRPNARIYLPELHPLPLSLFDPKEAIIAAEEKALQRSVVLNESALAGIAMSADIAQPAAPAPVVSITSNEFSTEYHTPERISLPSGGDAKRIELDRFILDSTISITAVPSHDTRAMIIADTVLDSPSPLLPGNVSLYLDHQFVGSHQLGLTKPDEHFKLNLGEDDKVSISFRPDPDQKSESGVFSKRSRIDRYYLVRIDNQHSNTRKIIILSQFPIASDDLISVERVGDTPTREDIDDRKGVVAWDFDVPAGGEQTLRYGYRVSYPADMQIQGL